MRSCWFAWVLKQPGWGSAAVAYPRGNEPLVAEVGELERSQQPFLVGVQLRQMVGAGQRVWLPLTESTAR